MRVYTEMIITHTETIDGETHECVGRYLDWADFHDSNQHFYGVDSYEIVDVSYFQVFVPDKKGA